MSLRVYFCSVGLCLMSPTTAYAEWQNFLEKPPKGPPPSFRKNLFFSSLAERASPDLLIHSASLDVKSPAISDQRIGGLRIEGAWTKSARNPWTEESVVVGRVWNESNTALLDLKIKKALANKEAAERTILKTLSPGTPAAADWPLELVLLERNSFLEPTWVYTYIPRAEDRVIRVLADINGKILEQRDVQHELHSATGSAYPLGPLLSPLSDVVLERLSDIGRLKTPTFEVVSALEDQARPAQLTGFRYDPSDLRFDQVQSFVFAQAFMDWCLSRHNLKAISPLEIKVQVGKDNRSNSAFYYNGRIRLGSGDGVRFENRLRDPSVVYHEVMHAIIDRTARLPSEGPGAALNEAFADYFSASMIGDPRVGRVSSLQAPYVRSLEDTSVLPSPGENRGIYETSLGISASFWELRNLLGAETADTLIAAALARLGPSSELPELRLALEDIAASHPDSQVSRILNSIFVRRNWPTTGGHL